MLTTIYEFWCRFISRWTAIVPVSHSIDEETGELLCGHSECFPSSTSLTDLNSNKKMIEPPPLEWRQYNQIKEMPEPIVHQKDCYDNKNSTTTAGSNGNTAIASTDTDSSSNLRTAKSPSCKSSDEKSEKLLNS